MTTLSTTYLRKLTLAAVLLLPGLASAASHQSPFVVNAKVLQVEPLVRLVEITRPQEVCWEEAVAYPAAQDRSHTPKILGGIIGGVFGNQFGGGRGRDIMTVAGALLGASIGNDAARKQPVRPAQVAYKQRCEVEQITTAEERNDGYRVTYLYSGREFVTRMARDPGKYLRLRVQVQPVAYNGRQRADSATRPARRLPA
jgi:uncharacterized protein YcfJ